jgi:hypothetical protein
MLERVIEVHLVQRVREAGGIAYKFASPARRSVPDRLVIFPCGRLCFVEVKRPGGTLTHAQAREHTRLRALGCDVRVIDSRAAIEAFILEVAP